MAAVRVGESGQVSRKFAEYSEAPSGSSSGLPGTHVLPAPPVGVVVKDPDWTKFAAAGTMLAGGLLVLTGHKRAGLAVAAAGTAIALLEEQDAVKTWWKNIPGYLREAQAVLDKVEGYMEEAATQGHKLQSILRR